MDFKRSILAAILVASPVVAHATLTQSQVNHFAKDTELLFSVEDNFRNKDAGF